jgi:hypothetical protein
MAKKLLRDIWDETPFKLGVYIHKKTKKIALAHSYTERGCEWSIDQGKTQNHPFFRIKLAVTKTGNGNFFFHRTLKDYDFLQENVNGFTPGRVYEN